jgi:hypothetical protein
LLGNGIDQLVATAGIEDQALRHAADDAATAFIEFERYLRQDLATHRTEGYAAGREALELVIGRGHFLPKSADEIDVYARRQFEDALNQLQDLAAELGATWQDTLAKLRDIHPDMAHYYACYGELWEAHRSHSIERDLLTWPDYPIEFVPRPAWVRSASPYLYFLFYRSPAPFDRLVPVDYLVEPIEPEMPAAERESLLRSVNESVIKLNHVVHHAGIGHHVQNWHAARAASRIGQIAAVDCASRIAMPCGGTMAEGWAVYATGLMDDAGFTTPLEHLSEVHSRLRMAARAIVDVGLHTGDMSFDEAVAFYRDRTGMSQSGAEGEVVKNSMFPGMALMYLMGEDGIRDLRRELESRDPHFSLRAFHDRLLSYGSIPVPLIAEQMLGEK